MSEEKQRLRYEKQWTLMCEPSKLPPEERRSVVILLSLVLSRLPVQQLLRCRCVCKFWFAFISCSSLVFPSYSPRLLVIKQIPGFIPQPSSGLPYLRPLMIGYQAAKHLLPILLDQVDFDEFPFDLAHDTTIVGSLGGVTCLFTNVRTSIVIIKQDNITDSDIGGESSDISGESIITGRAAKAFELRIPTPDGRRRGFYPFFYGIGYGSTMNDHKIVLGRESLIYVYSVRSDSWSVISGSFCGLTSSEGFLMNGRGCYIMGALHWLLPAPDDDDDDDDDGDSGSDLVAYCKKSLIVAFNLGHEEYMTLKIIDHPGSYDAGIGPFGNYSLFYYICNQTCKDDSHPLASGAFKFELWVLKDYMLHNWVKIGEIHPEDLPGRVTWFTPIFIAQNGEVVLRSRGCTVIYSLTEKKILYRIDGVEDAAIF